MPKAQLNRQQIIEVAIAIADEEGLHAVSLRGIAKRLKVHVTSLYNHIATKEALLVGMNEALMARADLPLSPMDWQDWVRSFVSAVRALAYRHPGAFQLFLQGPAQGLDAMRTLDAGVAAFLRGGFSLEATQGAIKTVNAAATGMALDGMVSQLGPTIEVDVQQLPEAEFPNVHRLVASEEEPDTQQFLMDALVAGLAACRDKPEEGQ